MFKAFNLSIRFQKVSLHSLSQSTGCDAAMVANVLGKIIKQFQAFTRKGRMMKLFIGVGYIVSDAQKNIYFEQSSEENLTRLKLSQSMPKLEQLPNRHVPLKTTYRKKMLGSINANTTKQNSRVLQINSIDASSTKSRSILYKIKPEQRKDTFLNPAKNMDKPA